MLYGKHGLRISDCGLREGGALWARVFYIVFGPHPEGWVEQGGIGNWGLGVREGGGSDAPRILYGIRLQSSANCYPINPYVQLQRRNDVTVTGPITH